MTMPDWPAGDGEMARRIRAHDWAATPLGPIEAWPPNLRTVVDLVLGSPVATILLWGPTHTQIYNDHWRVVMSDKHPAALGQPTHECFPEIADTMAPLYERVRRGEAVVLHDMLLPIKRGDGVEDAWWNVHYLPLRDESGAAGIFCTVIETTTGVLAERERAAAAAALRESEERQAFLLRLSDALRPLADPIEIMDEATRVLGEHLGADRTDYSEIDNARQLVLVERGHVRGGAPSLAGTYTFDFARALLEEMRRGRPFVTDDVRTDARIGGDERPACEAAALRAFVRAPLVRDGRLVASLGVANTGPRRWAPWEVGLIQGVAERTWAAVERARAEAALRKSEARYRTLFEAIDEGFLLADVEFDEAGEPVDIRYVEANPAAIRMVGTDPTGRSLREMDPDYEPYWYEIWGRVARTGRGEWLQRYAAPTGTWYDFYVFRPAYEAAGSRRVAVVFRDVTVRLQEQDRLRQSEEWQAFLLTLSDALRPLRDPRAVQTTAMKFLAERLGVTRAGYYDVEPDQDAFSLTAGWESESAPPLDRMRLVQFGADVGAGYRAGRTLVFRDAEREAMSEDTRAAYRAIGVRARVGVPLVKDGRLLTVVAVHSAAPRDWTATEVQVVEDVAERTWAAVERARAEAALTDELRAKTRLHELADRLLSISDLSAGLGEVLDAALEIFRSSRGTIQILDPEHDFLRYAATRGFDETVLAAVPPISRDFHSTCAVCIRTGERVVAADFAADPSWKDHACTAAALGYGAAFSAPMKTRRDELLGVLTIYFETPRTPSERELRWSDLFTQMAAHLVERAGSEAALQDSEQKYRDLFEKMEEGYLVGDVIFDDEGRAVDVEFLETNQAAIRMTGVNVIGRRMREIDPNYEEYWYEYYGKVASTGVTERATRYAAPVDRWYDFRISKLDPNDLGSRRVAVLFFDASARVAAGRALRESEQRYQALFAASPVPFMVLAANPPDFTITAANDAYYAATLTTPETLIGRRLFDVFTDDPSRPGQLGSEALALSLDRVLTTRRTDAMERVRYDIVTPDGGFEPHWWLAINAPLLDAAGGVSAIIHQVTRVTELHLAEEAEREHQERQAFLLKLSDALRPLTDPVEVQTTAMKLLAERLGVMRASCFEIEEDGDTFYLTRTMDKG